MGEGFTRDLVRQGWRIAMVDLRPNAALLTELGNDNVGFFEGNVADYDSRRAAYRRRGSAMDAWTSCA